MRNSRHSKPRSRLGLRITPAFAVLIALPLSALAAQSLQPVSMQASGEWVSPTKDYGFALPASATVGWELQARLTSGRVSLGAGYQRSTVFQSDQADLTGTLSLGFVEPRVVVVVLGQRIAPYLAGRLGYGSLLIPQRPSVNESVITYGGGAGVLIALVPRLALDMGGQYFVTDFQSHGGNAGYWLVRLGAAVGLF